MTTDACSKDRLLIVAATGNAHKLGEFRAIFSTVLPADCVEVISQKQAAEIAGAKYSSPDEDGQTFGENAYIKTRSLETFIFASPEFRRHAASYKAVCVIADDSGLCVDALGGAPGIYSARYASEPGSFEDADDLKNVEKLLSELKNVPDELRTGRFECHISAVLRFGNAPDYSRVRIETAETRGIGRRHAQHTALARRVLGLDGSDREDGQRRTCQPTPRFHYSIPPILIGTI